MEYIRKTYRKIKHKASQAETALEQADAWKELVMLARDCGDPGMLIEALTEYGGVIKYLGRGKEAEDAFLEVKSLLEHTSDRNPQLYLNCIVNLANLYRMMNDQARAENLFLEALAHPWDDADPESAASLRNNLALLYQEQGRYPEALALHQENLDGLDADRRPEYQMGSTLNNMAILYLRMGQYNAASDAVRQALVHYESLEETDALRLTALNTQAAVYYGQGDLPAALALFEQITPLIRTCYGEESSSYESVCKSTEKIKNIMRERGTLP